MSRQKYTEEQIILLRRNPYVYSISASRMTLTKEFKEIFVAERSRGKPMKDIFADHGFDLSIIEEKDIWRIAQHIRSEYNQYGEFHDGSRNTAAFPDQMPNTDPAAQAAEKDEIRLLRNEVEFLKQEIEFLKKISSIRKAGK